jgi:fructuronate reductase
MRLSQTTLGGLPGDVLRPTYDRDAVKVGVVHLGIGAFHRAHQAAMFDDVLGAGDLRWGIVAASLRSPAVRDQMAPQDGLYTMLVRDGQQQTARIMGAVQKVLIAPEAPAELLAVMAAPDTQIVTLTITEKGYKLDPASGALIEDDPQLAADMLSLETPRTALGYIVAALAMRRSAGLKPFTAISCDNLPHNGARLRGGCWLWRGIMTLTLPSGSRPMALSPKPWWTVSCPPPRLRTLPIWRNASAWKTAPWSRPSPSPNG